MFTTSSSNNIYSLKNIETYLLEHVFDQNKRVFQSNKQQTIQLEIPKQ